jgi:hypothetical protein
VRLGPVYFSFVRDYVTPLGYWLFKLYNQARERNRPIARCADAVFISTACMNANKRPKKGKRRSLLRNLPGKLSR